MDLNTIWFVLYFVLISGYAMLDGFDLGVGVLHLFTKNEEERQISIQAIGPFWDGNEVWLLTAGGALFAAFPRVYATVFSAFYLVLVLVLMAFILRAVSIEFRNKVDSSAWKKTWDWIFGLGSLFLAFLLGVASGNILRGLPLDTGGIFTGSFFGLLNPYALLVGLLSLVGFTMHGATYLSMKTVGDMQERLGAWIPRLWIGFVSILVIVIAISIPISPFLFKDILHRVPFWIFFFIVAGGLFYLPVSSKSKTYSRSFLASSLSIVGVIGMTATGLFPRMVPSSVDLMNSLSIYNASSTPRTLKTMFIIALLGMPVVIVYTVYIYRVFRGKVDGIIKSY